jgi:hypothetical protein
MTGIVMEESKPFRHKKWNEMDDKERIQKLSTELARTQEHLDRMSRILDQLLQHEHLNGKLVKRLETRSGGDESSSGSSFRLYDFSDK